jgi:hypothetical protein
MRKLRAKCKVIEMTVPADDAPKEVLFDMGISRRLLNCLVRADRWRTIGDIRYTPDLELRREPQLGRFTIAELRSFIPYVGADGADLSWWERCCSGRAALSDPGDSCDT